MSKPEPPGAGPTGGSTPSGIAPGGADAGSSVPAGALKPPATDAKAPQAGDAQPSPTANVHRPAPTGQAQALPVATDPPPHDPARADAPGGHGNEEQDEAGRIACPAPSTPLPADAAGPRNPAIADRPEPPPAGENDPQAEVFAFLADPRTHGLAGDGVTRIDTHSAVVFLAGRFAYKVKRAVRFAFLDFSTLDKRAAACAAEVEVNRAYAPGLYLGVVPIVRGARGLELGGGAERPEGEVVEHAVKMRRFKTATLDHLADRRALSDDLVANLARVIAASHAAATPYPEWDTVSRLAADIADNDRTFAGRPEQFPKNEIQRLTPLFHEALEKQRPLLEARCRAGFVRRCHGDLHLRNIVLIKGEPVLFDAIEFSADIATCDVLYDLAFLLMDLWKRNQVFAANLLLNRYLWLMPDEALDGLAALPLFLALRATIRAKVEAAMLDHLPAAKKREADNRIAHLLMFARDCIDPNNGLNHRGPLLAAVGGLSGSGKTTRALRSEAMVCEHRAPGAVVLRSDIERKRLAGVGETDRLPPEAYGAEMTERVYARLRELAGRVLKAGRSVVVDAVHARPQERAAIEAVARDAGVRFVGIWLEAPEATMIARVSARTNDASDADAEVVRQQMGYDLGEIDWVRIASKDRGKKTRRSATDAG